MINKAKVKINMVHDRYKVTIITPVYNAVNLLKSTLNSIQKQSYQNFEYIVVDGGSTDGTLELLSRYDSLISHIISEKDMGMYDALAKGLRLAKGDVICYLNAGDMFYEKALEVVVKVLYENDIKWITGYRTVCNEDDIITRVELPFRYKSNLIKKGVYGKWLPYVQQESTFWKKELNQFVNLDKLQRLKFAGDYYLWHCFSDHTSLEIVKTPLGIFKKHDGQLSEAIDKYWNEVELFSDKKNFTTVFEVFIESVFWILDVRFRQKLVKNIWEFDCKKNRWRSIQNKTKV